MERIDAVQRSEQVEAASKLAVLNSQADAVRAELARLRHDLATIHDEQHACQVMGLQAANEKLLIAALDASAVAETAKENLASLTISSQRDALTNTPNRALTLERLENAIGMAKRHNALVAVFFLDIDHLKSINDALGHAAGDAALQLVARRLESVVRSTDTVSRHGGDEFVVLTSEIAQASDAADIAMKMLEALALPAEVAGHVLSLTASIGIAVFPMDAFTGPQLIEIADSAMYVVKRLGGCQFGFHEPMRVGDDAPVAVAGVSSRTRASDQASMAQLRQANEQLVMTSLAALEFRELADAALGKEVKFMALVAHELRTPLTPIRLAADMMGLAGADGIKLKKLQAIIEEEVDHLVYLIEDLLDASRISTGKLRMSLEDVDVVAVLAQALEASGSCMTGRSQTIAVALPSAPIIVRGNKARLKQVFCNLLENASKYTPAGGHVDVSLDVVNGEVVVIVSDNGVGIPAHALPHIFDLFVQEAGALALHSGGLGIGLALVHELVAAHRGTVSAESGGRDQGSKFIVTLPALSTYHSPSSALELTA